MAKKELNYVGILNKGYYLGKYLPPQLQDSVFAKISELAEKDNPKVWEAYKTGIAIGIRAWRLEQVKRQHHIQDKNRGDDLGLTP